MTQTIKHSLEHIEKEAHVCPTLYNLGYLHSSNHVRKSHPSVSTFGIQCYALIPGHLNPQICRNFASNWCGRCMRGFPKSRLSANSTSQINPPEYVVILHWTSWIHNIIRMGYMSLLCVCVCVCVCACVHDILFFPQQLLKPYLCIISLEGFHIWVYCLFGRISHMSILPLWKDFTYEYIASLEGFHI